MEKGRENVSYSINVSSVDSVIYFLSPQEWKMKKRLVNVTWFCFHLEGQISGSLCFVQLS